MDSLKNLKEWNESLLRQSPNNPIVGLTIRDVTILAGAMIEILDRMRELSVGEQRTESDTTKANGSTCESTAVDVSGYEDIFKMLTEK